MRSLGSFVADVNPVLAVVNPTDCQKEEKGEVEAPGVPPPEDAGTARTLSQWLEEPTQAPVEEPAAPADFGAEETAAPVSRVSSGREESAYTVSRMFSLPQDPPTLMSRADSGKREASPKAGRLMRNVDSFLAQDEPMTFMYESADEGEASEPLQAPAPPPVAPRSPPAAPAAAPERAPAAGGAPQAQGGTVLRFRFHVFNMANAHELKGIDAMQGHCGHGNLSTVLRAPLADGSRPDVVFVALPEAPLDGRKLQAWCAQHKEPTAKHRRGGKDSAGDVPGGSERILLASAKNESVRGKTWAAGLIEDMAGDYNGDLKTLLSFSGDRFVEDPTADVFGLLTDIVVAGVAVPNPKKAFVGRGLSQLGPAGGLRISFVGTHFPITGLSKVLEVEDPSVDALATAKLSLAATLRKVLRTASRTSPLDERTLFVLQGDLNSRTILQGGEVYDVLHEVLSDDLLQRAIQHGLAGVPSGRWHEPVRVAGARDLPVTYKFRRKEVAPTGPGPSLPGSAQRAAAAGEAEEPLRIGDIVSEASKARLFPSAPELSSKAHSPEAYKQMMVDAEALRERWGLAFKQNGFRPFRFPAGADRVIYWAPDALQGRLRWHFPRGGYHVNHRQGGSDHKPVSLEAVLEVAPPTEEAPPQPASSSGSGTGRARSHSRAAAAADLCAMLDSDGEDAPPPVAAAGSENGSSGRGGNPVARERSRSVFLPEREPSSLTNASVLSSARAGLRSTAALRQLWSRPEAGWNWTPDNEASRCEICDMGFTIFRRRHHCRLCGNCVCNTCSPPEGMRPLPERGIEEPCRICVNCAANDSTLLWAGS